jgi:hypothetical protein
MMARPRLRRMARIERAADDIVTYKEAGMLMAQLLDCMRLGMLQSISDPDVIWDVLTEVTDAAHAQLQPLGYGLTWVLGDE